MHQVSINERSKRKLGCVWNNNDHYSKQKQNGRYCIPTCGETNRFYLYIGHTVHSMHNKEVSYKKDLENKLSSMTTQLIMWYPRNLHVTYKVRLPF